MDRRSFLELTAGAALASAVGSPDAAAEDGPVSARLDAGLLRSRNGHRSTVVSQHGMVCASQPLAAMAGIDILKAGGNCVDAAIATNAALGVTEPASNGIGGDLFAILWSHRDQQLFGLNASGRAPYEWNLREAAKLGWQSIPRVSALSWSVPGCVSGWGLLNERFGALKLSDCLQGAIDLATNGFPLSPIIAGSFGFNPSLYPSLATVYHPAGRRPRYGEVFRNPHLARSLEDIAQNGPAGYYEGRIADRIVAKSRELGGKLGLRDLRDHRANWVEPVSSRYRGWDIWEIPPNGQGIAALQMLNILEQFDIGGLAPNSAEHLHLLLEAKKLAFEDRAQYYADPAFADVPVERLISKEYAKRRAALIDQRRARQQVAFGDPRLDSDTIYMAAADRHGNMISLIQSIYSGFGSALCPEEVGFSIQNRGQAFSLDPHHNNRLEPHKRPFHTIIPAFMTRGGRPVMPFGVMGGDFQPQGHAQVVMNMIDFGMSPQQAGDQPRISHSGSSSPWGAKSRDGGAVSFERGIADNVKLRLAEMGHHVQRSLGAFGGYQAIWRLDDPLRYFGGSDPRKDGAAIGY